MAPANRHLLAGPDGTLSLSDGELVHSQRPSAVVLLMSVAESYKTRALAVVLTGKGRDGIDGVRAVKARGGTVLIQDPRTAAFSEIPSAAIATGNVDMVLRLDKIAPALTKLASKIQDHRWD